MSRQFFSECLAWATADGTAIVSTATETIIFPNITIPANYMQDGRVIRVTAYGRYGASGTPALSFKLRWGGVAGTQITGSGAQVVGSGVTAAIWQLEAIIQTRSNGATGTVFSMGTVTLFEDALGTAGTVTNYGMVGSMGSAGVTTPAAVTVDLTADTALSITALWGTSHASNTLTGHIYILESLN